MRPTLRQRLRYAFDEVMSRGTAVLVGALLGAIMLAVLVFALILTVTGTEGDGAPDDFWSLFWHNLMRTLDPGTMADDQGPVLFVLSMFLITMIGVFVFSALIGVISAGMERRFESLRKGRSIVLAKDHVVVLGWTAEIFTVISELVVANENQPRSVIVVMADRDKVEMEEELAERLDTRGRTKIVCRTGQPTDVDDIDIANVQASRAIVVLSPDVAEPDADVLKILLAVVNDTDRRPEPYHIVAEMQRPANVAAARLVGRDEVEFVVADHAIAKIMAQTCRQPGLSVVYTELLNFSGDEIYMPGVGSLVDKTFADAVSAFETTTVIGVHDGRVRLNPPSNTVLKEGDRLIAIAEDDDSEGGRTTQAIRIDEGAISTAPATPSTSERTLVLGWNHRGAEFLTELDKYVTEGSEAVVVADTDVATTIADSLRDRLRNTAVTGTVGDTSDRATLEALHVETFDHVVVLSYAESADVQHADGRTLTTLIHLRDIATLKRASFSITTEMLDVRNRSLGEVAKPDDFIISNHIVSLLLAQIAENKHVAAVFDELFAAEGADIYLRPAEDYVALDRAIDFYTIVEATRRRGEVALGYRTQAGSDDRDAHYGIVFNPRKSASITFRRGDRIIVLAEE